MTGVSVTRVSMTRFSMNSGAFNRVGLLALAMGAFGIGLTEFVIMGLLPEVSADLGVTIPHAGLLISGYAMGVVVGAPLMTLVTSNWPQKRTLILLMLVFIGGNALCALATDYTVLMIARVVTAFAHGTFFGVGSIVATRLVPKDRSATAISLMFTGLTVANVLGVPLGTWLGQQLGWRSTFWAVTLFGIVALLILAAFIPPDQKDTDAPSMLSDLHSLKNGTVILGLITTVLGFGGSFALLTYISPILTDVGGFESSAVPGILLLFGIGVVGGNLIGGRFADKYPFGTLVTCLISLVVTLIILHYAILNPVTAVICVGLLGVAAFSVCTPLQFWVLSRVDGPAQAMASSLNQSAFNLGNAIGAAAGGAVISQGFGLNAIPWVAAVMPLAAIGTAWLSLHMGKKAASAAHPKTPDAHKTAEA